MNLNKALHHLDTIRSWRWVRLRPSKISFWWPGRVEHVSFVNLLTLFLPQAKRLKRPDPSKYLLLREEKDQSNLAEALWGKKKKSHKYAVSPAGRNRASGLVAFISHPQLLSSNAASGLDNWSWLVKWVVSSVFKIPQLFLFSKKENQPSW